MIALQRSKLDYASESAPNENINIEVVAPERNLKNHKSEINHIYGKKIKFPDNKDIRSELKPKSIGANSLFGMSQVSAGSPRIEEYRKIK
jgi:hypothetical protein